MKKLLSAAIAAMMILASSVVSYAEFNPTISVETRDLTEAEKTKYESYLTGDNKGYVFTLNLDNLGTLVRREDEDENYEGRMMTVCQLNLSTSDKSGVTYASMLSTALGKKNTITQTDPVFSVYSDSTNLYSHNLTFSKDISGAYPLPANLDTEVTAINKAYELLVVVSKDTVVTPYVSINIKTFAANKPVDGSEETVSNYTTGPVTLKKATSSDVPVTGVTLDETALTITAGKTAKLNATVAPDNATNKTVTWTTDKDTVATVSNDGTVTAVAKGTATITATAGGKSATCAVTVTNSGVAIADNVYYVESELTGLTNDTKFVIRYGAQSKDIQQTLGQILGGEGVGSLTGKLHFAIKPLNPEANLDYTKFVIETK